MAKKIVDEVSMLRNEVAGLKLYIKFLEDELEDAGIEVSFDILLLLCEEDAVETGIRNSECRVRVDI